MRGALIWGIVAMALVVPLAAAASSPLLAWREPVYIVAGFAGIFALALMLIQPLLAAGLLPGLPAVRGRRMHKRLGLALVAAVLLHVAGLWITSPPDVLDALLFVSPTPFSAWGVIAMWAVLAAAIVALMRRRLPSRWTRWQTIHISLVSLTIGGTVVHALLIEGIMELISKVALCALTLAAFAVALIRLRSMRQRARRSARCLT